MSILTQDDGQNQGIENSSIATTDTPYTSIIAKSDFDIRNYVHLLEPNPDSKDKYICPNCGKNDLSIKRESSEYNCFSGCGDNKAIRRKCLELDGSLPPSIEPVALPVYESRKKDLKVSRLPEKLDLTPSESRQDYEKDGKLRTDVKRTIYQYGSYQKVREDYLNEEKILTKTFRHVKRDFDETPFPVYRSEAVVGKVALLVEGEKCTDYAVHYLGIAAFSIDAKTKENAIREALTSVETVVIFPDNDKTGKEKASKYKDLIESFGKEVIVLNPQKVWQEMPLKGDIVDWINHHKSSGNFDVEILIQTLEAQIQEEKAKVLSQQARNSHQQNFSTAKTDPCEVKTTVEQAVIDSLFSKDYVVINGNFYKYKDNSVYEKIPEVTIERQVARHLPLLYAKVTRGGGKDKTVEKEYKFAGERNKKNCISFARSFLSRQSIEDNTHLLSFNNGVLDIRTGELLEHNKNYYLTYGFKEDYKRSDECPKLVLDWLKETIGEGLIDLMRALFSMYLDPTAPYGYFVHLIGQSGAGKGTLIDLIQSFFPQEVTASLGNFNEVASPEKRFQQLSNVRLATLEDVGGFISEVRDAYKLVDNNPLSGRQLHNSTAQTIRWNCRFIIASVLPLSVENAGDGWSRRCIPIQLKRRDIKTTDTSLKEKLRSHKGEVIMWALSMDKIERDELIKNARYREELAKVTADQNRQSSSVLQFIDACLTPSIEESDELETHTLFKAYCSFCQSYNLKAFANNQFTNQLKDKIFAHFVESKPKRINGEVIRIKSRFKNLNFAPNIFTTDSFGKSFVCDTTYCREGGIQDFEAFDFNPKEAFSVLEGTLAREYVPEGNTSRFVGDIATVLVNDGETEVVKVVENRNPDIICLNIKGEIRVSDIKEAVYHWDEKEAVEICKELNTTPEQLGLPNAGDWIEIDGKTAIVQRLEQKRFIIYRVKGCQVESASFNKPWKAINKAEYAQLGLQSGVPC